RDGKYAVTFDAATLQVKILKNTDYREFNSSEKKTNIESSEQNESNENNEKSEINETIAHFKINNDLSIKAFYDHHPSSENPNYVYDKWSIDISNDDENFIFIAASRIDENFMKETEKVKMVPKTFNKGDIHINLTKPSTDFRTVIYSMKIRDDVKSDYILKEFILLNSNGIYSFKYNETNKTFNEVERFNYPEVITNELEVSQDHMNLFLSHLNKQYFLVVDDDKKVHEVHDLTDMKLETSFKSIYNDKCNTYNRYNNQYYKEVYSIDKQKLQFCFALGPQTIGIYLMEHGLEIAIKTFENINIQLIEFINSDEKLLVIGSDTKNDKLMILIWDVYDTDKVETMQLEYLTTQNLNTCLASTSGNLLQVDDEGNVTSILKMIELKAKNKHDNGNSNSLPLQEYIPGSEDLTSLSKLKNHTTCFYANENEYNNFEPIIIETEPWITIEYEKFAFYLCHNKLECLQLIVGTSTIQIWHQVCDKKEERNLPNDGRPFLEFIWTNGIPSNQENEDHKLRITSVRFGSKYFRLEVYWYEGSYAIDMTEMEIKQKMKNKEEIDGMMIKEKIIEWSDINEGVNGIRYACEALEFLNLRVKSFTSYDKIHKKNEMVKYINHIVWRFTANKPQRYRLLDIRYHVMKNLILVDKNNHVTSKNDNDNCKESKNPSACMIVAILNCRGRNELKYPTTDVNLAIYHCRDRKPKDTIIVTYILEYYLIYAYDFDNLLRTVSDAYILLNILKYEEYTRMLKNEWHTFEKYSSKDPINNKSMSGLFKLFKTKLKSPGDDTKRSRFTKFQRHSDYTLILKHILLFIFIPRWYKTNRDKSKIIPYVDIDDMFDLPIIEKTINNRWPIYIGCIPAKGLQYYLFLLIGVFYYLAIYLFITELMQLTHHGCKKYLSIIFNWFDLLSIAMPVVVMTKLLIYTAKSSNEFGSIEAKDSQLILEISYSILIIWIEFILYFRLIPNSTLDGVTTNSSDDNPFSSFTTSLIAAYYWTNGNFVQRERYNSLSVEVFTIIISILVVIILQNMLIAIMGNVYESAAAKSKQAVLKYKAIEISDYDDLQHRFDFWYHDPEFIPSKKRVKNFKNDIHQDKYISEFAKELDYDRHSIWQF
ncbi:6910_t:CDS:10, partial [Funneliformis geosporum]